jgi:hypothetical protein
MFMFRAVGALFVILALVAATWLCIVPLWQARASLGWAETRCQIQSSQIQSSPSLNEHAIIKYTYEVRGTRYTSNRVDFAFRGWFDGSRESALSAVKQYPTGSNTQCWYDPGDPDAAVLSRSAPATGFLLFPLLFGAGGFLFLQQGARRSRDDAPGVHDGQGRCTYVRRGSTAGAVVAIAAMWLVAILAAIPGATFSDRIGQASILACVPIATLALLHELRCLLSVVTVTAPAQLHRGQDGEAECAARSPMGSPRVTASLIATATTSGSKERKSFLSYEISYEITVETVLKVPVAVEVAGAGAGKLRVPNDAPASTPERQIEWFVEVHVHLPLGPDITVRVPVQVRD